MDILNLNGYRFFAIPDPIALKEKILAVGRDLGIKGSVLLANEGINLSISGVEGEIRKFTDELHKLCNIDEIPYKESWSVKNPFKRFWVKVKKEIVTMGRPGLPLQKKAPYIKPEELKKWFEEGKDFVLIDARKDFEYRMGHFKGAKNLGSIHFRDFPERLKNWKEVSFETPIVTYCTGGIRCEKAAPFLQELGYKNTYQLEGGILRYFEKCGGEYFEGDCFVFDHRAAVDKKLSTVEKLVCRSCESVFERDFASKEDCGLRMLCSNCLKATNASAK